MRIQRLPTYRFSWSFDNVIIVLKLINENSHLVRQANYKYV